MEKTALPNGGMGQDRVRLSLGFQAIDKVHREETTMRAIWTGSISFGLVNIPVKLYSGSESNSLDLDMLRKSDLCLSGLPDEPLKIQTHSSGDPSALSLEESERNAILRALQQAGFVQKEAANLLGISRRAIHYKIKKYGIDCGRRSNKAEEDD